MTKRRRTRRALINSVISLLICFSMLLGTTFAWFTDSVSSTKNQIIAGNLDIELEYSKDMNNWTPVADEALIDKNTLWEPGHTEVVYLKIINKGTLDLKYNFSMNVEDTVVGKSVEGNDIYLSKYLKYDVVDVNAKYADRDAARKAVEETAQMLGNYTTHGSMTETNESKTVALVVYMPETVTNEANYRGEKIPQIELGINLFATQIESESDSFGNDYDANATWAGGVDIEWYLGHEEDSVYVLDTAEELAGLAAIVNGTADPSASVYSLRSTLIQDSFKGKTIKLGANIDLNDLAWTPINGFNGTFDGQNHTISNLNVSGSEFVGFIGKATNTFTIKNVKFDDAFVTGNHYVSVILGWEGAESVVSTIENCHVSNSVINVSTINGDDGDKAGGIAGYVLTTEIKNCSVTDISISAYRDAGGILGYANGARVKVENCKVSGLEMFWNDEVNYKNYKDVSEADLNTFVGETAKGSVEGSTVLVSDMEELKSAMNENADIVITEDIVAEPNTESLFESDGTINVDGNGTTITTNGVGTTPGASYDYGYVGFIPEAGEDATVSNLKVVGSGFVEVGHHGQGGGDYTITNLVVEDLVATLAINNGGNNIAAAFSHYGNAVMTDCVMTGTTTLKEGYKPYDAAFVNGTKTEINGGEYGVVYLANQAHVTIKNAEVDVIDSYAITASNLGKLTIGAGAKVGTINLATPGSYKPALVIEDGAEIGTIVYKDETYTAEQWNARQ